MIWSCVVNHQGNCKGTPDWEEEPIAMKIKPKDNEEEIISHYIGGKCKLDPATCGRFKSYKEQKTDIELGNSYKHTVTLVEKTAKNKKKEEVEQGKLI